MQPAPFDGKGTIVFSCSGCPQKTSGPSLYVVNADGTRFRQIETPRLSPFSPRWSPSGRRISLSSNFSDIWTIDPQGRAARRLTQPCSECDYTSVAWSPDGRRLVFARKGALFTIRSNGSAQRRLFGRWRRAFGKPDWSPDGKKIAFDESGSRLQVIRADGTRVRELRRVRGRYPRWSPSGKWIAFIGFTGSGAALMVVRADGTHPRLVARGLPLDINCSPGGPRTAGTLSSPSGATSTTTKGTSSWSPRSTGRRRGRSRSQNCLRPRTQSSTGLTGDARRR